jgi:hypothetical protein
MLGLKDSPESPRVAIICFFIVGCTFARANTQITETGIFLIPRGTALTEKFICVEDKRKSALPGLILGAFIYHTTGLDGPGEVERINSFYNLPPTNPELPKKLIEVRKRSA